MSTDADEDAAVMSLVITWGSHYPARLSFHEPKWPHRVTSHLLIQTNHDLIAIPFTVVVHPGMPLSNDEYLFFVMFSFFFRV